MYISVHIVSQYVDPSFQMPEIGLEVAPEGIFDRCTCCLTARDSSTETAV